jgi:hypothetical protein
MTTRAKLSEVKAGDILVPDGTFSCLSKPEYVVYENNSFEGGLVVTCDDGTHYIHTDEDGFIRTGLVKKQ